MSSREPSVYTDLNVARNLLHGSGVRLQRSSLVMFLKRIDKRLYNEFWSPAMYPELPADDFYEKLAERLQVADQDALIDALRAERDDFAKTAQDYERLYQELLGVLLDADQVKYLVNLLDAQAAFTPEASGRIGRLKARLLNQAGL